MFLYRVENLEDLKARGGFLNDFTGIEYSRSFNGDKSVPRLYFFKDIIENFIGYLEYLANEQDNLLKIKQPYKKKLCSKYFYPVRFKELLNYKENFDEEWSSPKIAYYYEFSKDEPKKLIVSIEDIEYWDKEVGKWKKL